MTQEQIQEYKQKSKEYLRNLDYKGLLEYRKKFTPDANRVAEFLEYNRWLKQQDSIYKAALARGGDRNKIDAWMHWKNGDVLNLGNPEEKKLMDAVNYYTGPENTQVTIWLEGNEKQRSLFSIPLLDALRENSSYDDGLQLFKTQLGNKNYTNDDLKNKFGIIVNNATNYDINALQEFQNFKPRYKLTFNINPENTSTIFNALKRTNTNHSIVAGTDPNDPDPRAENNAESRWIMSLYYPYARTQKDKRKNDYLYTKSGDDLDVLLDAEETLKNYYNSLTNQADDDTPKTVEIRGLGIRSAYQANYLNRLTGVNETTMNNRIKEDDELMLNDLMHTPMSNYNIYELNATQKPYSEYDENEVANAAVFKKLDPSKSSIVNQEVAAAAGNNENTRNNVDWEIGTMGDKLGLIVYVTEVKDKDDDTNVVQHTYFIEDFLKGRDEWSDAMYNDETVKANLDLGSAARYGYDIDVISDEGNDEINTWLSPEYSGDTFVGFRKYTQAGNNPAVKDDYLLKHEEALKYALITNTLNNAIVMASTSNIDSDGNFYSNPNNKQNIEGAITSLLSEAYPKEYQEATYGEALGLDVSHSKTFIQNKRDTFYNWIKNHSNNLIPGL